MPTWGGRLSEIDLDKIVYYRKPSSARRSRGRRPRQDQGDLRAPGHPEAERKFLAGVGAQYDSEVVYHSVREELTKIGVVFMGTDQALIEYPEIFRKYFGTVVPARTTSSPPQCRGLVGRLVRVRPEGRRGPLPLQAYFRINGENTGQFERTLIVVEEGAKLHYIEGCTAPIYAHGQPPRRVVEVIALPGSKSAYTTIQNWSNDVYNLVTKRAHAYENSTVEWIDANTGSRLTMKYPAIYLRGKTPPPTSSRWPSPARASTRTRAPRPSTSPPTPAHESSRSPSPRTAAGLVPRPAQGQPGATNVVASVRCDALMLDDQSRSDTYPYIDIQEDDTTMTHEATVGKISATRSST